ncbi:uncharacterized protein LOC131855713 [Achroia grisella]|uniref:uncharacterized protein LOC131855713 n=1 Tax=Achroia grisella TaxID=688607 RepID=UPI0027D2EF52|nr:uncharacterized protein LOC131855713 [Achroia grisella]
MAIIQSCCCWRSLRKGCYAAAIYTMVYFSVTVVTMGHFIDVEHRYLNGAMTDPLSESFLEPEKITPLTVSLNISLLACSTFGLLASAVLVIGIYTDKKYLLVPWIVAMILETTVEIINIMYLFYLQFVAPTHFNPVTSFLFTMDFFLITINIYAILCVISQYQEYSAGRGTAADESNDRIIAVQFIAHGQHTITTNSVASGRRRSGGRPMPSRHDPEDFSEAPGRAIASMLSKTSRSAIKKHVQFPDERSCVEEGPKCPVTPVPEEKPEAPVISSLWMELESETPTPER